MYPQWYYNCHGVLPDQCLLTSWFEMMTHDVISPDTSTTIKSLCLYWSAHKTVAHWSRSLVAPQGPTEAVRVARWHSRLLNLAFLSFYYSLYLKRSTGGRRHQLRKHFSPTTSLVNSMGRQSSVPLPRRLCSLLLTISHTTHFICVPFVN